MTKQLTALAITTALTAGMAAPAFSASKSTNIDALPSEGYVSVTGTVTHVDDANEFTVSDKTGAIEIETEKDVKVYPGDTVTVKGRMDTSWFDKEIEARSVRIDRKGEYHTSAADTNKHQKRSDYSDKHWGDTHNETDMTGKFIDKKGNLRFKDTAPSTETRRDMIENSQYHTKPVDSYAVRRTQ